MGRQPTCIMHMSNRKGSRIVIYTSAEIAVSDAQAHIQDGVWKRVVIYDLGEQSADRSFPLNGTVTFTPPKKGDKQRLATSNPERE